MKSQQEVPAYQEPQLTSQGMVRNPLRVGKYRNKKCLCGSDRKVKNCCGIPVEVPSNLGNFHKAVLDRDQARAQFFAKAWEDDIKAANKLIEESKNENGNNERVSIKEEDGVDTSKADM